MEHPIPQNITSFEFRLVGDMTLKQFVYLATGLGLAYLIFVTVFGTWPIIAVPLILAFAGTGTAFAFLPILDRPLDHWIAAFFRAVYSPTQGRWIKDKIGPDHPLFTNRLTTYLATIGAAEATPPPPVYPTKPIAVIAPSMPSPTEGAPSSENLHKLVNMAKEVRNIQLEIAKIEQTINQLKTAAQTRGQTTQEAQKAQEAVSALQHLLQQSKSLKEEAKKLAGEDRESSQTTKVVVIEPPKAKPTELILTSLPNVINGIVTDQAGNYLEGVIVIIHNQQGLPVRALKTNKLGQFTGATPLASGTYTLTLEKEGYSFDTLQTTVSGEVISPIKIVAKNNES